MDQIMDQIRVLAVPIKSGAPDPDYDKTHYSNSYEWDDEDKQAIEGIIREVKNNNERRGTRSVDTANGKVVIYFRDPHPDANRLKLVEGFLEPDPSIGTNLRRSGGSNSISQAITFLGELGPRLDDKNQQLVSMHLGILSSTLVLDDSHSDVVETTSERCEVEGSSALVLDDSHSDSDSVDANTIVFEHLLQALEVISRDCTKEGVSPRVVLNGIDSIRDLLNLPDTKTDQ